SLILVARRADKLEEVKSHIEGFLHPDAICLTRPMDVTDKKSCDDLFELLCDQKIGVFINNAGFGDCCYFPEGDITKELNMIDVNVKAMHYLTKLAIRRFRAQKMGYLLNVASIAGLMPCGPYMATYYATKAYVASFTLAIAKELRDHKSRIYAGCLCPGPVDTEFDYIANVEFSIPGISPAECASIAISQMKKRRPLIIPKLPIAALALITKLMPREVSTFFIAKQQLRKIYR
ncbi:MAG: SDR family NAD(P)-dependent oxidoreductase, partial [Lachnospiraceae bacterium]|nr:SDR family NAD(P)-dependent oxidoreductase [Lachnospiraceae bacterium]